MTQLRTRLAQGTPRPAAVPPTLTRSVAAPPRAPVTRRGATSPTSGVSRREGLRRALPFTVTRAAEPDANQPDDGLNLEGLAAVFNTSTTIDSWEGRFKEQLIPGSFKKTLRDKTPVLQFDHGQHPLIGSLPIGVINRAWEDGDTGVRVNARMSDNWLFEPVREAISSGAISGMSFRFSVVREEWVDENGKKLSDDQVFARLWLSEDEFDKPEDQLMMRNIKEVNVAELGPVVFPAYAETEVGVRSVTIDLGALRGPRERAKLARAIFVAEQAETPESEAVSAPPLTGHPGTTTEAAAPPANAEHPASSTPDEQRADAAASLLARMNGTLARIHARSEDQ